MSKILFLLSKETVNKLFICKWATTRRNRERFHLIMREKSIYQNLKMIIQRKCFLLKKTKYFILI